jgi:hypothetical protein
MTLMNFLCRLLPSHCPPEQPRSERPAAKTSADLGQKEAKTEAQSEEHLSHMKGGGPTKGKQTP